MSEIIPAGAANAPAVSVSEPSAATRTPRNAAVQHCLEAHARAFRAELARRRGQESAEYKADRAASLAYRQALPDLIGTDNIRDFIACITHGLAINVIHDSDAARLLYAAQVAITATPREPRPVGRPRRETADNPPQPNAPSIPAVPPPFPPSVERDTQSLCLLENK